MEAHHLGYLEHNELPSASLLHEIQRLKTLSLRDLSTLETKILEAERTVSVLKRQHEAIQSSLQAYDLIASPIRRLPEDLLHEIFIQCLPSHRSALMSAHEAPLLLTQICSKWRSTALVTPRLWMSIVIPLPLLPDNLPDLQWNPTPEEREQFTARMYKRCEAVPIWLARSGSLPLSLSVVYPQKSYFLHGQQKTFEDSAIQILMYNLLPFLDRVQTLELSMPSIFVDSFFKCMLPVPRKGLASLGTFRLHSSSDPAHGCYTTIGGILSSPKLHGVYLATSGFFIGTRSAVDMPPNWAQLTALVMQEGAQDHEAYNVLRFCRRLIVCKLYIYKKGGIHLPPWTTGSEVTHPHLEDLTIIDGGFPEGASLSVLKTIRAPALRSFRCDQTCRGFFSQVVYDSNTLWEWVFENSPGLTSLCFDPREENSESPPICYKLGEKISKLLLGHPAPGNEIFIGSPPPFNGHKPSQLLTLTASPDPEGEALLPKLEVLRAHQTVCSSTDQELLNFIISRLDPTRLDISVLKEVTITFARTQQKDIREEVLQHAKRVGVSLQLSLVYHIPIIPPQQWHPGSAKFGLVNDRVFFG